MILIVHCICSFTAKVVLRSVKWMSKVVAQGSELSLEIENGLEHMGLIRKYHKNWPVGKDMSSVSVFDYLVLYLILLFPKRLGQTVYSRSRSML